MSVDDKVLDSVLEALKKISDRLDRIEEGKVKGPSVFRRLGTFLWTYRVSIVALLLAFGLGGAVGYSFKHGRASLTGPASLESQVRSWAAEYPVLLRDKWSWCYRDSVKNWSTDQKLREDVRQKTVRVLSDSERKTLVPLDRKISVAVPEKKQELKETYREIGDGLKVDGWEPTPETVTLKKETAGERNPTPPSNQRRRLFRR